MRITLFFAFFMMSTPALPDIVVCEDPIDNAARMGIPGSLNYSLTEDNDDRECRFSIEGVPAGSPPAELLGEAASQVRDPFNLSRLAEAEPFTLLETIALLLASASPVENLDESILMEENAALLQECVFEAREGGLGFVGFNSDGGFSCSVLGPDEIEVFNSDVSEGSVRLEELDGTRLVIRNERDTLTEYLFLNGF